MGLIMDPPPGIAQPRAQAGRPVPLAWYNLRMPSFPVETPQGRYSAIVERGIIGHTAQHLPAKAGKVFVVTTADVWRHAGPALESGLADVAYERLDLPGGEDRKRLAPVEELAEEM